MVLWVAALTGLVAIVAIVAIFSVKSDTRRAVLEVVTGTHSNDRKNSWSTAAGEELTRANSQHYFIAYYIAQCFNGVDLAWDDRSGLPPQISIPLMFGLQPNGEIRWGNRVAAFSRIFSAPENVELRKAYDTISSSDKQSVKLNNYQKSILTLSNAISTSRTQLASSAAESDSARYLLQISIIVIGALTTILVSAKSIIGNDVQFSTLVGISAIVFSAFGTALSSLNSFVGPAESFAKTERSLLLARQLHLDLSLFSAAEKDLCGADFNPDKKDDPRTKKIADLSDKLREIVGPPAGSAGTPTGTSQPSGAGTPDSGSGGAK